MMEVRIKPTKLLFANEEDLFFIYGAEVNPEDLMGTDIKLNKWGNISFKGNMPKLAMKEEYKVVLKPDTNSNFQGSYILETIKQDKPVTIDDQKAFLSTILTPTQVSNIFEVYNQGEDIVSLIENNQFDFNKVKGLGEKTFEKLQKKVMDNVDMAEVLKFCARHSIRYNTIAKLVKEYKNPTIVIEKINQNPYVLTEVKGIGFKKADEIAKAVGYSMTSSHRIDSAIRYIIAEENQSGHSWINRKQLLNRAIELLNIDKALIEDRMDGKIKGVMDSKGRFTKESVYEAEQYVAMRMTEYKTQSKKLFDTEVLDRFLDSYCEKNNVELEENQRQFFHDWNEHNIVFLIGGGGMGKSWLQRILLELIAIKNYRTALLAPTGKASKVMTGYTGKQASTIHRRAGVFGDDEEASKEINEDVIIIDESSMCDVFILSKFFKALTNPNARVLFVGDDFQLPSVGVGNFLYDSINSGCIKISQLKKVFRQEDGGILDISTKVRNGQTFLNGDEEGRIQYGRDCVFWLADQQFIRDGVITNYKNVIKKFHPDDVVILSPTNKGKLGTIELNKEIQKIANPASPNKKEKVVGHKDYPTIFRVGDTVMNTVNTYKIETIGGGTADIFNGDTGKIMDIDEDNKDFIVDFEGITVKIKFGNILNQVVHSWVTTIHKSQGSQYKVVIVIIDKSMKFQINANLIYTGFSRAKQFMLVLGQADAINHGIKKFANMERRSFLQEMLNEFNKDTNEAIAGYVEEMEDERKDLFEEVKSQELPEEGLYL